ncbi:hypothetical protein BH11PSE12_BH11PSE12_29550 [soil metagenome]
MNLFKKLFFFLILMVCALVAHAQENSQVKISVPSSINEEMRKLSKLESGENIELNNSLVWKTDAGEYYYLAVAYKKNQGCRFVFLDAKKKIIVNNGGLFFEKCSFLKPPELIDLNNDNFTDFRVWVRLPHHVGSKILVKNYFDFIYKPEVEMFCEHSQEAECGKVVE